MVGSTDSELLARLAEQLGTEQGCRVRRISGTPERPTILAVSMPPERAEQLRAEYPDRLVIEVDQPLEHF